jgi:hypothetical protein
MMRTREFLSTFHPFEYGPTWDDVVLHLFTVGCCDDIDWLVDDIRENGIIEPVLVSIDGYVVNGHHRVAIASNFGLDIDIPFERFPDVAERYEI